MDPISLLLLALVLSLDSLMVGLLYGLRGIRLPWGAMAIVSLATACLLTVSMASGRLLAATLSPVLANRLGALILALVGLWITYQTIRTELSQRRSGPSEPQPLHKVWRLRLGSVGVVIEILREPGAADLDRSGHINPVEALFLGVALALDSVAAGLGAAMTGFSPVGLPLMAGLTSFGLLAVGSRLSRYLPFRLEGPWAAVHGVLLTLLGLYRMIV